ncbi:MAG: hypothetical protein HY767_04155, partial [Candidatus Omnitrophica bacterium]|nr:hypothetical protein [Candidatus Omnitrophota bacterium]
KRILFVDTDSRDTPPHGTELLIYKTLLNPDLIRTANDRFNLGLDMKLWKHPERRVRMHYLYLGHNLSRDGLESEGINADQYASFKVTGYEDTEDHSRIGNRSRMGYMEVDSIAPLRAIENRFFLNADNTASAIEKEPYGIWEKYPGVLREGLHEIQYAGLLIGTLEYLAKQGYDVNQEADVYLKGLRQRIEKLLSPKEGGVPVATTSPKARSEARLFDAPLVALTGAEALQIEKMARGNANPDAVRAWFLKQGQAEIEGEKVKFDEREAELMAQLQGMKNVDALMEFISSELPPLLVELFGMTDAMAAGITAQVMVGEAEQPVILKEAGGVRRPGVGKVDVGKIQRATASIYDLIDKIPGSGVPMVVNNGPDAAVVLQALKKIEIPRLIVLYDEHNPVGRGWNDASRIVMKYRFSERKPANALVGDVIKGSDGEPLMAFLTTELGVEQRGILSILAVFASQDNPELKKLVCAAAVLINRLYASASPMEQELMKVDPGMLITKLKDKGIDLLALSARNGVLVMSMEALALEFSAQKDIEKAA